MAPYFRTVDDFSGWWDPHFKARETALWTGELAPDLSL
jgi:hypothetical protein